MERFYRGELPGSYEPGTILGPNSFGELLVSIKDLETGEDSFWTATKDDILAAREREPRSVTEFNLLKLRPQSEVFGL